MKIGRRDRNASGANPVETGRAGIGLQARAVVHHAEIGLRGKVAVVPIAAVIADAKGDGPAAAGDPSSP